MKHILGIEENNIIILDLGNGSVIQNDRGYIKETIDSIAEIDTEKRCYIKWQLFMNIPPKEALRRDNFHYAYCYAKEKRIATFASVFDYDSLHFLVNYNPPFIKIANQPYSYYLINDVSKEAPNTTVITSARDNEEVERMQRYSHIVLCCVSDYPATKTQYRYFAPRHLEKGISDHTDNTDLFVEYQPKVYEKHYLLDKTTDKPRKYALRPEGLKELLDYASNRNDAPARRLKVHP